MTLRKTLFLLSPLIALTLWYFSQKTQLRINTVWIYASIYKEVITELDTAFRKHNPDIHLEWYQSGSENVAARVNAELASGQTQADILMTSDPFWFVELKKAGHLLPYRSPSAATLPRKFSDSDDFFLINRVPVGIIAYHRELVKKNEAPQSWESLTLPKWKNKLSMPSPLESGTAMTFVSQLVRKKGWNYFEALKANHLLAAGGNSAVMQKIETKEKPIGVVLLENALQAQTRGAPIEIVYPIEGAIPVPSPIAITSKTRQPELAKKVYDFFLTPEAQAIFLKANVYSPVLAHLAPANAKPFSAIEKTIFDWDGKILEELNSTKENTKKTFTQMIQR